MTPMAGANLTATGGDGSLNIAGNNNSVLKYESFQRTWLYEVCLAIKEANIDLTAEDDYSLQIPSGYQEKLDYNNVSIYAEIFGQEFQALNQVEEVIRVFPNRADIIKKIRHIYRFVEKERGRLQEDGDYVLEGVFKQLCALVDESNRPVEKQMPLEQKERFIKLVMFYSFTKCQLLKRVGE